MRTITSMQPEYLLPSLELVEQVFTEHENADEGKLVRRLVEEIRSKKYYLPELELLMLEDGEVAATHEETIGIRTLRTIHTNDVTADGEGDFTFVVNNFWPQLVGYLFIIVGAMMWWFGLTWLIDKVRNKFDVRGIWIINRVIGVIVMLVSAVVAISVLTGNFISFA